MSKKAKELATNEGLNEEAGLAIQGEPTLLGQIQGEITADMIKIPYLNLVQRVGELCETFEPGTFVYNRQVQFGAEHDLEVTVLAAEFGWMEELDFGEGMPRRWPTKDAAADDGMNRFTWGPNNERPDAQSYGDFTVALSVNGDLGGFVDGGDGRYYAVAKWLTTRAAHQSAGRVLAGALRTTLRDRCFAAPWRLSAIKATKGTNKFYKPLVRQLPLHDAATLEILTSLI